MFSYFLLLTPFLLCSLFYVSAELVDAVRYFDQRQAQAQQQDQQEEVRDKLAFLELQAQVHTGCLYLGPIC